MNENNEKEMSFSEYQSKTNDTANYPINEDDIHLDEYQEFTTSKLIFYTLKAGIIQGNISEIVKKLLRNKSGIIETQDADSIWEKLDYLKILKKVIKKKRKVFDVDFFKSVTNFNQISYNDFGLIYLMLGLQGETSELLEKILNNHCSVDSLKQEGLKSISKEIGDTLWYLSQICERLGLSLAEIAKENIEKLADRKARDVINGEGDDR